MMTNHHTVLDRRTMNLLGSHKMSIAELIKFENELQTIQDAANKIDEEE